MARRDEHAWRERNREAEGHQARASGRDHGGSRSVHISSASSRFFENLARAWQMPQAAQQGGAGRTGYDTVLSDHRAIGQAAREMAQDIQLATDRMLEFQGESARVMSELAVDMRQMRREERDHMRGLLELMATQARQHLQVAQQIQTTYAGMGAGAAVAPPPGTAPPVAPTAPAPAAPGAPAAPVAPPPGAGGSPAARAAAYRGRFTRPQPGPMHGPPMYQPFALPTYHRASVARLRANVFNQVNQRWGLPAAIAAHQPHGTRAQRLISSVAGPMSRIGLGAMGIPVVGTAVAAGMGIVNAADWLTEQRAANAQYQQVYNGENFSLGETISGFFGGGGSDATSGSGTRAAGFGFQLGQLFSPGGLTGQQSQQAFQGVTGLGYTGQERSNALGFITGEYKERGMAVEDTLKIVQTSAQYANQALAGVSEGLDEVSAAAARTGQNAKVLRDTFTGYYEQALRGGAGASAATLASAMTTSTAGVTRQLAGTNMAPMITNPVYQQQIAAQAGMTPGQLQSQMAQGNFMAFAKPAQELLDQRMLGVMDPGVRRQFEQLVREAGGNEVVGKGPGAISNIATQLMENPSWNIYAVRSALQSVGVDTNNMNDQQVAEFYVTQMTTGGMGAQAQADYEENKAKDIPKEELQRRRAGVPIWGEEVLPDAATGAYREYQTKTGKTDPGIEAAMKTFGPDTKTMVQVQTKSGAKVVSMDEAIRNYSDQLSAGTAIIASGEHEGKKVADVTGVVTSDFVPGKGGAPDSSKQEAKPGGMDPEDYKKIRGFFSGEEEKGGGGGTVTIEPTPELARLFNFTTDGNVVVGESAAQGVPPQVKGPMK